MPFLTIFRQTFVDGLKSSVPSNLGNYRREDKWATQLGTKTSREIETRVEMKSALTLDEPDGENLKDLENAIRVHKALQQLTPLQARDPRVWTRLAHVDCWKYMRGRWPVERWEKGGAEKVARGVVGRYFVPGSDSRALLRNGIARLWWTAQLTYDATRDNPYELTSVLFSKEDIMQQMVERNMGRGPEILTGFLEFLLQNKSELLTGGDKNRDRIRRLAKFLNMYGGVCLLDCLSQTDIIRVLSAEFAKVLASEAREAENKKKPSKVLSRVREWVRPAGDRA
jgi:hypothetical protein